MCIKFGKTVLIWYRLAEVIFYMGPLRRPNEVPITSFHFYTSSFENRLRLSICIRFSCLLVKERLNDALLTEREKGRGDMILRLDDRLKEPGESAR